VQLKPGLVRTKLLLNFLQHLELLQVDGADPLHVQLKQSIFFPSFLPDIEEKTIPGPH
jgi:hypothetical protein